jgi:hypothetical protein
MVVRSWSVLAAATAGVLLHSGGWTLVQGVAIGPVGLSLVAVVWFAATSGAGCRRYAPPPAPLAAGGSADIAAPSANP